MSEKPAAPPAFPTALEIAAKRAVNYAKLHDRQVALLNNVGLIGVINDKLQTAFSNDEAVGKYLFRVESTDQAIVSFDEMQLQRLLSEMYPDFDVACCVMDRKMMILFQLN